MGRARVSTIRRRQRRSAATPVRRWARSALSPFTHAANIWASTLDSNQTIYVQAAFNPLAPNVLGSAGSPFVFRDFGGVGLHPGAEFPETWYGSALADKRAGEDLNPEFVDIVAQFSSNFNFYLGVDNNHGPLNDLVAVLLHEFAHGLNFQNFVNEATGANAGVSAENPDGFTDIYARHTLDTTNGLFWNEMTQAQRMASAVRFGRVVWEGVNVNARRAECAGLRQPGGARRVAGIRSPALPVRNGGVRGADHLAAQPVSRTVVLAVDANNVAGPSDEGRMYGVDKRGSHRRQDRADGARHVRL